MSLKTGKSDIRQLEEPEQEEKSRKSRGDSKNRKMHARAS